jgi:hypothetical protein
MDNSYNELKLYDGFQTDSDIDYLTKQANYNALEKKLGDISSKKADLTARRDKAKAEKKLAEFALQWFSGKTPQQMKNKFKEIYRQGTSKGANNPKYSVLELGQMDFILGRLVKQSSDGQLDAEFQGFSDDIQEYVKKPLIPHEAKIYSFFSTEGSLHEKIKAQG